MHRTAVGSALSTSSSNDRKYSLSSAFACRTSSLASASASIYVSVFHNGCMSSTYNKPCDLLDKKSNKHKVIHGCSKVHNRICQRHNHPTLTYGYAQVAEVQRHEWIHDDIVVSSNCSTKTLK